MKIFISLKQYALLLTVSALFFTACNKLELEPTPVEPPTQGTTPTLATLLDDPNFSYLKAAATKAGLLPTLSVPNLRFTVFAPDNTAFTTSATALGLTPDILIGILDSTTIKKIISYHVIPQAINASNIAAQFPNFEYPSILNPSIGLPSYNPLARLSLFPSKRTTGAWANNIPITGTDIQAVNGVVHKVGLVILPPQRYLWDTAASEPPLNVNNSIFAASDLTYFKAAIQRADSGVAPGTRLYDILTNFGANVTVLAPTDNAMKTVLIGLIRNDSLKRVVPVAPATAPSSLDTLNATLFASGLVSTYGTVILSNPGLLSPKLAVAITPQLVKGLLAYHILGSQNAATNFKLPGIRAFSVNWPTSPTAVKTLVNQAVPVHPGVTVSATFTGPFVSAATVKGLANATAANVIINPLNPIATDLHFVNGVLLKIDQVLLPQPL